MNNKLAWITKYNKENDNEYKNYIFSGKYLAIYMPSHHKARADGYVYIHQLQAEKKLGRYLNDNECVHHIDENKYNNDIDNLLIFNTKSDHTLYHKGASLIQTGDTWSVDRVKFYKEYENKCICPICGKNKYKDAKMCIDCYNNQRILKSSIPSKEILKNLIINYPMTTIGKMFNVSDNAIRKWCKKYGLPYRQKAIAKLKSN